MKTSPLQLALIGLGAFSLAFGTAARAGTFQLQVRSSMISTNAGLGAQGSAQCRYSQGSGTTNQILQLNCQGLATNQIYHLMGSWGTNGQLIHIADFTPDDTGSILMQFSGGPMHHYAGTNNPGQAWGMMGGWTNHMSWVVFPMGKNWDWGSNGAAGAQSLGDNPMMANGMGGMMGGPGTGGSGNHWPEMTNWWANMTNWSSEMGGWSWNYTNMWNPADNYGGPCTNWWGSLGAGPSHIMPLPDSINFLPAMNGLVVMDQRMQAVLVDDLANPDTFIYNASCTFTNAGTVPRASGSLRVAETQHAAHFTLTASGLSPNASYNLNVNAANLIPVSTDSHGRLRMHSLPAGLTTMRGVGVLSIQDQNGNTVLSATLPPN